MDEGQRTFGVLLIVGALVGGWLYNTGRIAAVWQAIQGKTGSTTLTSVTPAYQTPVPNAHAPVIPVKPGQPLPPELQSEINQLQSYLNPNVGGSFYAV